MSAVRRAAVMAAAGEDDGHRLPVERPKLAARGAVQPVIVRIPSRPKVSAAARESARSSISVYETPSRAAQLASGASSFFNEGLAAMRRISFGRTASTASEARSPYTSSPEGRAATVSRPAAPC